MRREHASVQIQKNSRFHKARQAFMQLRQITIVIQTGLRAMAAKSDFRFRQRTKAARIIQVSPDFVCEDFNPLIGRGLGLINFLAMMYTDTMAWTPSSYSLQAEKQSNNLSSVPMESKIGKTGASEA